MKAIFDQHIGIFENAVPKEWCNKVINLFNQNISTSFTRKEENYDVIPTLKEDIINDLFKLNPSLAKNFMDNFNSKILPLYISKYKLEGVIQPPINLKDFKLQKTQPTEGYHIWHIEYHQTESQRIMVYTLYLNDVEEGGETEFLIQSKRIKPTQGTIAIFPAGYTHIHRGNPPLSGDKYIMTGWLEVDLPQ